MTKQQVVNKVRDLIHDNKALWHITGCLEQQLNKQRQEINKLYEEMRQMQETSSNNTE